MPNKITYREVAVMSAESGSIEIYTLPQKIKTEQDLEDYLYLELEIDSSTDWIAADKILLSDYRSKK